jgi:uncharacterized protein (DUF1810 family)
VHAAVRQPRSALRGELGKAFDAAPGLPQDADGKQPTPLAAFLECGVLAHGLPRKPLMKLTASSCQSSSRRPRVWVSRYRRAYSATPFVRQQCDACCHGTLRLPARQSDLDEFAAMTLLRVAPLLAQPLQVRRVFTPCRSQARAASAASNDRRARPADNARRWVVAIMDVSRKGLQRFVDAQAAVFAGVCAELAAGRKRTRWMWFVFPQLGGLGHSRVAQSYAIASASQALAYWRHPVLGPRLKHCAQLVLDCGAATAHDIFGTPDDLKLRSCMTLFAQVAGKEPVFTRVLARYCAGQRDPRTLALLGV